MEAVKHRFDPFLDWCSPNQRDEYWSNVPFPYVPFYTYTELISAFVEHPGGSNSLLRSAEYLTACLSGFEVLSMVPIPEAIRHRILSEYMPQ